jgi:hypothetical protein
MTRLDGFHAIRSLDEGKDSVKQPPHILPQNRSVSAEIESGCESEALTRLSEEDRAFIVQKLAEMLVLDFEENQAVPRATVEKPSLSHRRAGVAAHHKS